MRQRIHTLRTHHRHSRIPLQAAGPVVRLLAKIRVLIDRHAGGQIYDAETGKLQDTVQLVTNNPTAMSLYKGNLYVASLGEYDDKADDNRGVEKVDLKAKKSELIISGEKLGAGIYGFVAEEETAYAAIYNGWGNTPVVKIDLEKKAFEKVEGIADAQKTMAVKNGVLYVGDHTYGEEKVYFYKDGKLTALEQPKGAQAPYSIALF